MTTSKGTRPSLALAALAMATLLFALSSAHAGIVVRSTDSSNDTSTATATNTISGFTVDPRTGGKLVLAASWESGDSGISATWNGTEAFAIAENSAWGRRAAILYLDDPTPGTGDIVVTYASNTASRVGVVNVTGAADGVDVSGTTGGLSGSLTTGADDAFVAGVYTTNGNSGGITGPFSSTLYSGNSGSSRGDAGYQTEATAGLKNYTWTVTSPSADNNALAGFVPDSSSPLISVLSTDSQVVISPASKISTLSFDAGATADKLIVQISGETSGGATVVTYDGLPLTLAAGTASDRNKGIYYLDNPYTGGLADLIVDMTAKSVVNGIALGAVSISGSAPGVAATAIGGLDSHSVMIEPTVDGSFIMAGFGAQGGGGTGIADALLTQLYGGVGIGSAEGAAGYINDVVALPQIYSFSGGNSPFWSSAAAFAPFAAPLGAVIPEPSTAVLAGLGLLGLGLIRRRRRQK